MLLMNRFIFSRNNLFLKRKIQFCFRNIAFALKIQLFVFSPSIFFVQVNNVDITMIK